MVETMNSTVFWVQCHIIQREPDILEARITSIFRVKEKVMQEPEAASHLLLAWLTL
jgi:hypothetical protein